MVTRLNEKQRKFLEWCLVNKETRVFDTHRKIYEDLKLSTSHEILLNIVLRRGSYDDGDRYQLDKVAKYYKEKYEQILAKRR